MNEQARGKKIDLLEGAIGPRVFEVGESYRQHQLEEGMEAKIATAVQEQNLGLGLIVADEFHVLEEEDDVNKREEDVNLQSTGSFSRDLSHIAIVVAQNNEQKRWALEGKRKPTSNFFLGRPKTKDERNPKFFLNPNCRLCKITNQEGMMLGRRNLGLHKIASQEEEMGKQWCRDLGFCEFANKDGELGEQGRSGCEKLADFGETNVDILQVYFAITPVYVGGSNSDRGKPFEGWVSIAGLQDVICCMKEAVIFHEFFNNLGFILPRGFLLNWHHGTGRTLLVWALIGAFANPTYNWDTG